MSNATTTTANADAAIARLHELLLLASDTVQTIYSRTPQTDERFVPVDAALANVEAMVREIRGQYAIDGNVRALARALPVY